MTAMPQNAAADRVPETPGRMDAAVLWFERHARRLILALAVVVILTVLIALHIHFVGAERREAAITLNRASGPGLQALYEKHGNAPVGPLAGLLFGQDLQRARQFAAARKVFEDLLRQHPRHPMAPAAQAGLAYTLESEDKLDEALAAWKELATRYPDSYLASQSYLAQGRLNEEKGFLSDAAQAYENLLALGRNTTWEPLAAEHLARIRRTQRLLQPEAAEQAAAEP